MKNPNHLSQSAMKRHPLFKKRNLFWMGGILVVLIAIILRQIPAKDLILSQNAEGRIELPTERLSETGTFFVYNHEGTTMELIAIKGDDGVIRTAFNRCQVCYGSGRGYFIQTGEYFVCQNCGNRYHLTALGTEKGGCNPSPIFPTDWVKAGTILELSMNVFEENKYLFE